MQHAKHVERTQNVGRKSQEKKSLSRSRKEYFGAVGGGNTTAKFRNVECDHGVGIM